MFAKLIQKLSVGKWLFFILSALMLCGPVWAELPVKKVATPIIAPNGGTFNAAVQVTIISSTLGATIYYTTDGSNPEKSSWIYSGPFILNSSATVKAKAYKQDFYASNIAEASFTINRKSVCGNGICELGESNATCPQDCPSGKPACSDGIDNDADNKTDYPQDPGCLSQEDRDENDSSSSCTIPGKCRYLDPIFSVIKTKDVVYTEQPILNPFTGEMETLELDVCLPKGDLLARRPVMIYGHGGKFLNGSKADADAQYFCAEYAKRGYVGISYNYRLANTSVPAQDRGWPAVYDLGAVVRFLRHDATNGNRFGIDPDHLFVAGFSAGSLTAMRFAYVNDTLPGDNLSWFGYPNDVNDVFGLDSPPGGGKVEPDSIAPLKLFLSESVDQGVTPVSYQCNLPDSAEMFLIGPAGPSLIDALTTLEITHDTTCFHATHTDLVESPQIEQILSESLQFLYDNVLNKI